MVQTTNKNIKIVKNFKKNLEKFGIEKMIFFGSRARGDFNSDSDFDIIAVSKNFEGIKLSERPLKVYLSWNEDFPLEVICYTPEEFLRLKEKIGIVQEAVREGIEI